MHSPFSPFRSPRNIVKNNQATRYLAAYLCNMEASRAVLNAWVAVQSNAGTETVGRYIKPVSAEYINLLDIILRKIEDTIAGEHIVNKMYMGYKETNPAEVNPVEVVSQTVGEHGNSGNPQPTHFPTDGQILNTIDLVYYRWRALSNGTHRAGTELQNLCNGTSEAQVKTEKRKAPPESNVSPRKKARLAVKREESEESDESDDKPKLRSTSIETRRRNKNQHTAAKSPGTSLAKKPAAAKKPKNETISVPKAASVSVPKAASVHKAAFKAPAGTVSDTEIKSPEVSDGEDSVASNDVNEVIDPEHDVNEDDDKSADGASTVDSENDTKPAAKAVQAKETTSGDDSSRRRA